MWGLSVALTAIAKDFPDETAGRLAEIQLTESRPAQIAKFFARWRDKGPILLRTLYETIESRCDLEGDFPVVEDRRPGFGVLRKVLLDGFGFDCKFAIRHSIEPLLDTICRMYQAPAQVGTHKGKWRRHSLRNLTDFLKVETGRTWNSRTVAQMVTSALGYRSTRKHPEFRDGGFPGEDGRRYHIELRVERQGKSAAREFL